MLKIKVFDESHEKDLENKLNSLILELDKNNQEVIDIKYSVSHFQVDGQEQVYCFSALIMYDDKLIDEYKLKKYEIKEVLE